MILNRPILSGQEVKYTLTGSLDWTKLTVEARAIALAELGLPEKNVSITFSEEEALLLDFGRGIFNHPLPGILDYTHLLGVVTQAVDDGKGSHQINLHAKFDPSVTTELPENFLLGSIPATDLPKIIEYLLKEMAEIDDTIIFWRKS